MSVVVSSVPVAGIPAYRRTHRPLAVLRPTLRTVVVTVTLVPGKACC